MKLAWGSAWRYCMGMMNKAKSSNRYWHSPDRFVQQDRLVDRLLGKASKDYPNGSHALLSETIQKLQNVDGLERIGDEVYCGLMGGDHFGESRYSDKYRLITVGVDLIKGVMKAAKLYLYMDVISVEYLQHFSSPGSQAGEQHKCLVREFDRMSESFRNCIASSMLRRKNAATPVKLDHGMVVDSVLYYLDGKINKYCDSHPCFHCQIDHLVKGALVWTICHEVAHEMHVNASKRSREKMLGKLGDSLVKFLEKRSDIFSVSDEHLDEYLCDYIAYEYIRGSQLDCHTKFCAFVASQLVCAVMAVREGDAPDVDVSADTHPHPLHRVILNQMAYLEMLCSENAFFQEMDQEVVRSMIFARFVAGYYSLRENGFEEFCLSDAVMLRAQLYEYLINSDRHFLSEIRDQVLGVTYSSSS